MWQQGEEVKSAATRIYFKINNKNSISDFKKKQLIKEKW